jgi:hypothetical protein
VEQVVSAIDDETRAALRAAADGLRELMHMPSPRRDERFALLAPALLELARVVDFAPVGVVAARLSDSTFVADVARALDDKATATIN